MKDFLHCRYSFNKQYRSDRSPVHPVLALWTCLVRFLLTLVMSAKTTVHSMSGCSQSLFIITRLQIPVNSAALKSSGKNMNSDGLLMAFECAVISSLLHCINQLQHLKLKLLEQQGHKHRFEQNTAALYQTTCMFKGAVSGYYYQLQAISVMYYSKNWSEIYSNLFCNNIQV